MASWESPCSRQEAVYDCKHDMAWGQPLFEKHLGKFLSIFEYFVLLPGLSANFSASENLEFMNFCLFTCSALHSFHTWDYKCPHSLPPPFSLSTFLHSLWNHNLTPTITFVQLSKGFPKTSLWFVMEEPVVMIFTFPAFTIWDTLWREGRMLIVYHRW